MRVTASSSALSGLSQASARLERSAGALAPTDRVTTGAGPADLGPTMERLNASLQFRANLKTLKAVEQMSDDLLSLFTR